MCPQTACFYSNSFLAASLTWFPANDIISCLIRKMGIINGAFFIGLLEELNELLFFLKY